MARAQVATLSNVEHGLFEDGVHTLGVLIITNLGKPGSADKPAAADLKRAGVLFEALFSLINGNSIGERGLWGCDVCC